MFNKELCFLISVSCEEKGRPNYMIVMVSPNDVSLGIIIGDAIYARDVIISVKQLIESWKNRRSLVFAFYFS